MVGLLLLAGVVAALIGGCGLRTPSGVRVDQRSVDTAADDPDIRKLPPGPMPGANPYTIVQGFLEAAGADPDHSFTEPFLAPGAVWSDRDAAVIYQPDRLHLTVTSDGPISRVKVSAQAVGTLSAGGAFTPTDRHLDVSYELRTVGGQWRISHAPPGMLLAPRDLARTYRLVRTYEYNADRTVLVPQPGYVSSDRAGLAGAALHALLTGWGNDQTDSATNSGAVPRVSASLVSNLTALGSVVVRDGEATVDLGREAFTIPQPGRPLLVSQIAATLGSVPGVFTVRVLVEERPYIGGAVSARVPAAYLSTSQGPAVAVAPGGGLMSFNASGASAPLAWTGVDGGGPSTAEQLALRDPAVSPAGTELAAMLPGPDPTLLLADVTGTVPPDVFIRRRVALPKPAGGHYLRPQWLGSDRVLMATSGAAPRMFVVDAEAGVVHDADVGDPATLGPLTSLSVSRDGTRVLAVAGAPGARRVFLSRFTTEPAGPTSTGELTATTWTPLPTELVDARAASWSADLTVTALGRAVATAPGLRAETLELDQVSDPTLLPPLPPDFSAASTTGAAPVSMISGPGRSTLISAGMKRWVLRAGQWSSVPPAWDSSYS